MGGKRTLEQFNLQIALQRVDERASGVISRIASSNGRRQRALHPTKISDARSHVVEVNGSEVAHFGAAFMSTCGEVEQCADLPY